MMATPGARDSPAGASLVVGRRSSPGWRVVYASRSYTGALPNCLAHAGIAPVPRTRVAVEIAIPEAVAMEPHDEGGSPANWGHAELQVARAFGDAWIRELRATVLVVTSIVVRREGKHKVKGQLCADR